MESLQCLFLFALECQVDVLFEYSSLFSYSGLALRTAGIALARLQDQLAAFRISASSKIFIFSPLGIILEKYICYSDAYLAGLIFPPSDGKIFGEDTRKSLHIL